MSKSQPVIPVNMTVYGNRVFADIIKALGSWMSVNPKYNKMYLKKKRRGGRGTQEGRLYEDGGRDWS